MSDLLNYIVAKRSLYLPFVGKQNDEAKGNQLKSAWQFI